MNVVKCKNGHFFDSDNYALCPHCGAGVVNSSDSGSKGFKGIKGLFGKHNKSDVKTDIKTAAASPESVKHNNTIKEEPEVSKPVKESENHGANSTLDFWQASEHINSQSTVNNNAQKIITETQGELFSGEHTYSQGLSFENDSDTYSEKHVNTYAEAPSQEMSLKDAIRNVSASNDGKTMSYFSMVSDDSIQENNNANDPVVGWLVCIGGKHFGESFNIFAGKNSIGRSSDNKIVLNRDNSVSREKHSFIIYEPKHMDFYIEPGNSSGLTYLNEEYITETKKLNGKDTIELGDSKFIFIPLCGDEFKWEQYISKE